MGSWQRHPFLEDSMGCVSEHEKTLENPAADVLPHLVGKGESKGIPLSYPLINI